MTKKQHGEAPERIETVGEEHRRFELCYLCRTNKINRDLVINHEAYT